MTDLIQSIIKLSRPLPPVLGAGAFLKNNLCLIQGDEAWISGEIGSLDSPEAIKEYYLMADKFMGLANEKPIAVAHDLHPDFPSTVWAETLAGRGSIASKPIQHHHAHIASVMAEHNIEEPVLGVALDGFGLGLNDELWGGELLLVKPTEFERIGHLYPIRQPGGDVAVLHPWRMGASVLYELGESTLIAKRYKAYAASKHLAQMMDIDINSPKTTSCGRLFDAACGVLGVKPIVKFEGEAPISLEKMVTNPSPMHGGWSLEGYVLDMRPVLRHLIDCTPERGANLFHGTLAFGIIDWFKKAAENHNVKTIAFSGGCFLNKVLRTLITDEAKELGYTLLWPKELPAGDQAISLGQAYAASLMMDMNKG